MSQSGTVVLPPGSPEGESVEALRARVARLERALAREEEKLATIRELASAMSSTLDLDELLEMVVDRITRVMQADRSTLYLLDDEKDELVSKVVQGGLVTEIKLRVGEGVAGWVAATGQTLNIVDAYDDERFVQDWDRRTGYRTRTILAVPMLNHLGRAVGVIQVLNKVEGTFSDDDASLLSVLASQAAVTLDNSRLLLSVVSKNVELLDIRDQLERKVRELDTLFEVAREAAASLSFDALLEGVLAQAIRAVEAAAGSILLVDDETGDLRFRCAVGGQPDVVKLLRIPAGQGICGWVARHGEAQIVNDVEADPRHQRSIVDETGYRPTNVLCVPIPGSNGPLGAIEILDKHEGRTPFADDDLKISMAVAGFVAQSIELARTRDARSREERLSTIGQLLSSVLHDLKTPMTIISGYVQLMPATDSSERRAEYAAMVLKQFEHINAMTREILAFARGESTLLVRKVYLHKLFDEMHRQLAPELEDRGVELEVDLRDRGVARFDENKIKRLIHNLVRNAAESFGGRRGHVVLRAEREGGEIVLTVADDGPGIPEAVRRKLFQSFVTLGKPGGSGLGLAIVKKIVDEHRGRTEVATSPKGTTFRIFLPQDELSERSSSSTSLPAVKRDGASASAVEAASAEDPTELPARAAA
ncbi:MAG: GAF domain-containing sensor histidine kinase, partial [Deltaproteobacteria bacterium]|nr:GAF domain-containing sensor histidine kinase [Deltaproteobacteria bacterium]